MPFKVANGINLYYEVHGEGTPLVLLAGYGQHSGSWKPFIEPFSKHFQVILVDNRGSGQSDAPPQDYSIELFAQDLIGLMNALNIQDAHLMGESMGTLICEQLCISLPKRVRKVILCAPFATLPPIAKNHGRQLLKLLSSGAAKEDIFRLNASWLLSNLFLEKKENLENFVHDFLLDPYPISTEGLYGQSHALFHADLRHQIETIPHEVLLLSGEEDILTPLYCAQFLLKKLHNAQLHTFKKRAHLFNYEIPEQSAKVVLNFLLSL